ncbi:MAG: hypothetical protein LBC63_06400 [Holophagales bacterium]|jgi:thiol-disulfide isomerase/thioredoxin|nr:hypothetical protein [Holophagales bacterium]
MKMPFLTPSAFLSVLLGFYLCLGLAAQESRESSQQQPPEQAQYVAAMRITDMRARIKELKRIKAAYPNSSIAYNIDYNLLVAETRNAANFGDMLAVQKEVIASSEIAGRFLVLVNAADMVLNHREAAKFPEDALKTIQAYRAEGKQLLDAPETFARYQGEMRTTAMNSYKNMFEIPLAKALLMNEKGQDALNVLDGYRKSSQPTVAYYVALGETYQALKRDKDALDAYFEAAISGSVGATTNAKALFAKINGSDANFDKELNLRKAHRPFTPPPFKAPENWQGKTVLAEVFTGSECGPCVAATFAFDALEKSYPSQYLAVLKYHLPIPLYDPMMNHATKKRQDYYGRGMITGTPTAIIDGVVSPAVGGDRLGTSTSFDRAKKEIDAALVAGIEVKVEAKATISGDVVAVDCEFSKVIEGADYNVALIQTEQEFKGSNGIVQHHMVVREFKSVAPSTMAKVTFNIVESEKAADAFITEWAKTASERNKQLSNTRHNKIDRKKLKAVVFVQDKKTKHVYNAFVAEVSF